MPREVVDFLLLIVPIATITAMLVLAKMRS